uniref:ARAD1C31284p n=1 Tax=Blastobotrys adeninivorans TaxID=409370 RepID=A0A060T8R8_BLAAD
MVEPKGPLSRHMALSRSSTKLYWLAMMRPTRISNKLNEISSLPGAPLQLRQITSMYKQIGNLKTIPRKLRFNYTFPILLCAGLASTNIWTILALAIHRP